MSNIRLITVGIEENSDLAQKIWLLAGKHEIKITRYSRLIDYEDRDENTDIIILKAANTGQNRDLDDFPLEKYKIYMLYGPDFAPNPLSMRAKGITFVLPEHELDKPEFEDIFISTIQQLKRQQNQESADLEQAYFQSAISVSPDAMIIFDNDRRIVYASDHYRRTYSSFDTVTLNGMPVTEAFDLMAAEQHITEKDPQYETARKFWHALEGSVEIPLKDGQTVRVSARKMPNNTGTAVTTTNITAYKKQEGQLKEQSQKLESLLKKEQEASEIQKQFISMVSHEFKTPLTIIDGNAQIMERRAGEITMDIIQKRSKTIRSAVSRLINLMDGILSSNMLETGNMTFDPAPFDLKGLIEELCTEQADLTPDLVISSDLGKIPDAVNLDKKMMTLIISNLLSNAVKFSSESPTIEINAELRDGLLLLQFNDNGIGIPESEHDRIFSRFYRASNTAGITGTGIGLNLVRQLVSLQSGTIKLVSVEGEGTTFYLTFPIKT